VILLNLNFTLEGRSHAECSLSLFLALLFIILHRDSWVNFFASSYFFLVLTDFLTVLRKNGSLFASLAFGWRFRTPRRIFFLPWGWFSSFNFLVNCRRSWIACWLWNIWGLITNLLIFIILVSQRLIRCCHTLLSLNFLMICLILLWRILLL